MLISQTTTPLTEPSLREALLFGGKRAEWEELFDLAPGFRHDDSVQCVIETQARREESRRASERRGVWCAPAPSSGRVARPHIFRAAFRKDIGGVTGASDFWFDADRATVDGGTGKTKWIVDYVDSAHVLEQLTSGNQPALPATSAKFGGAKAFTFVRASSHYLTSNRAASLWSIYNEPNGVSIWLAFAPTSGANTHYLISTCESDVNPGFLIYYTASQLWAAIGKSPAAARPAMGIGAITTNVATYVELEHASALTPDVQSWLKTTAAGSADYSVAPVAAVATAPLRVGASAQTAVAAADMELRGIYGLRRNANTATRVIFQSWFAAQTAGSL